ncbi:MAG: addiction module antitoxin [Rhodobacteraceae bacterium]|nr:addiction module antitoxin [Paracoccaceae bacterium]
MDHGTRITVRISGARGERSGDLIRRDKERAEREAFDRLKAELTRAFAAPEESYRPLSAADVIGRFRDDRGA